MVNIPKNVDGVKFTSTSTSSLHKQLKNATTSIKPKVGTDPQICSVYTSAKITQIISRIPRKDTKRPFAIIAINLLTPTQGTSYSGAQALLHLYNTNLGYQIGKPVLIRDKKDIILTLIHFINKIK